MNEEDVGKIVEEIFEKDAELGFCSHDVSLDAMFSIVALVVTKHEQYLRKKNEKHNSTVRSNNASGL